MKKLLIILIAAAIPAIAMGQKLKTTVKSEGPVVTQLCKTTTFDKVSVMSGIDLTLRNSPESRVTVQCAESIQPYVETFMQGTTLVIRIKPATRIINRGKIIADVSVPHLNGIAASGGSDVTIEGVFATTTPLGVSVSGGGGIYGSLSASDMVLNISGGGNMKGDIESSGNVSINLSGGSECSGGIKAAGDVSANISGGAPMNSNISCGNLRVNVSGGGDVTLRGKCAAFNLNCSGGGDAHSFGLVSDSVKANISGGGNGEFTTSGNFKINCSGGGSYIVKNLSGQVVGHK